MKALILAGGDITVTQTLKSACGAADLIVAADSGLRHAAALGVEPDVIVGDFDSVAREVLAAYPEVPKLKHPPEKDLLDLELALDYARAQNAAEYLIVGGLGSRFDQSLAALFIAARWKKNGFNLSLQSGNQAVYLLVGEEEVSLELPPRQLFSLLSLLDSSVSVENARYPLEHFELPFGVGLGVSNEVAKSPLKVRLEGGLMALVLEEMK